MNNLLMERQRDMEKKEKSSLTERLFSWSIKDILNRDLYKHQVFIYVNSSLQRLNPWLVVGTNTLYSPTMACCFFVTDKDNTRQV